MTRDWLPGEIPRPTIHVRVTADTSDVMRKFSDIQRSLMAVNQAHPDRVDWRAVIVNALALAYVLLCGLVVLWWLT